MKLSRIVRALFGMPTLNRQRTIDGSPTMDDDMLTHRRVPRVSSAGHHLVDAAGNWWGSHRKSIAMMAAIPLIIPTFEQLGAPAACQTLCEKDRGLILVVGAAGNPGQANYAAAKAGVAGMTRALARELGSRHITVNCVAPGFIDTDMTAGLPPEQQQALLAQIPLGHLGKPEDVAHTVVFLASLQASYITGQEIHVNGGMFMA